MEQERQKRLADQVSVELEDDQDGCINEESQNSDASDHLA